MTSRKDLDWWTSNGIQYNTIQCLDQSRRHFSYSSPNSIYIRPDFVDLFGLRSIAFTSVSELADVNQADIMPDLLGAYSDLCRPTARISRHDARQSTLHTDSPQTRYPPGLTERGNVERQENRDRRDRTASRGRSWNKLLGLLLGVWDSFQLTNS